MKLLTYTTLYPNNTMPRHGVFVENRLRHLLATGQVESRVVSPVPWFPFTSKVFGEYARMARIYHEEMRNGVKVTHPRYYLIPKLGMNYTPTFLASASHKHIAEIIRNGYDFDILDAHYFFPDGVAAAIIAEKLNKPLVITARGTDLNLIPQYKKPREMILWAASKATALITVCQALKDVLVDFGVAPDKVHVLRNGVDLDMFRPPEQRDKLRKKLKITGRTIISVGHLTERKGHDLIIRAIKDMDVQLLIAGDGEEKQALKDLVRENQQEQQVTFLGSVPHEQLRDYYGAVDALALASSREGWANVLLESMACGTPVVATNIWGTPEVVSTPEAGELVERSPSSISDGLTTLFARYPDRNKTRAYAERFSWDDTTNKQLELFAHIRTKGK